MIRLKKAGFFLIGFVFIVVCYFVRRFSFIASADTTKGYFIKQDKIVYKVNGRWLLMKQGEDTRYYEAGMPPDEAGLLREEVPIIYKKDDPRVAKLYTFFGFWFDNIAYFIIPLFVWAAFSLSYIDKNEYLLIDIRNGRFGKSSQKDDHDAGNWPGQLKLE